MRFVWVVLGSLALSASLSQLQGSIFKNEGRWPISSMGYTNIPVCIFEGSSSAQKGYGADSGLIHDTNPSLAEVITHVRKALSESWERYSNVRFIGWKDCAALDAAARGSAAGVYINSDAPDESPVGVHGFGKPTSFKPFGPSFAKCVNYNASTTHVEYTFDCAEQYAI